MTERRLFVPALMLSLCLLLSACNWGLVGDRPRDSAPEPGLPPINGDRSGPQQPPAPDEPADDEDAEAEALAWAEQHLARMSLPEKVGQLFVIHGYGAAAWTDDADMRAANLALHGYPTLADAVAALHPGGVIYFQWTGNLESPAQIAALSAGLQQASLTSGAGVPLLTGIDQEGGLVARLGPPFTQYPGSMALAAGGDPALARQAAAFTAAELRAVGINWNFAPVADVNVNPRNPVIGVRSFGSDPEAVAAFVAAQVRGYQEAGVAASAKHFPGHGDTDVDSHTGLPVIGHSRDELDRLDLPPFVWAIGAGVDSIMVAHIAVPALDPSGLPATFSPAIVSGLLRDELGYEGVIVTDALDMAGAQLPLPAGGTAAAALQAGADMLLMPPDPPAAIASVLAAVEAGEITEQRIDESVRRILLLKWRRGLAEAADRGELTVPPDDLTLIGRDAHQQLAAAISERAVTIVKNEGAWLPLAAGDVLVVGTDGVAATVAAGLSDSGVQAGSLTTATASFDTIAAAAAAADVTVVLTAGATADAVQQTLVDRVLASGRPVVVVALQDPYDLVSFPDVDAYVTTYSSQPQVLDALIRVLTGQVPAVGRLPVSLPGPGGVGELFPAGHGLP